jgi:multimeric flavodoxin WrbA
MARAVAEGVEAVDGAKVNLKHVLDADLEDLIQCDGLVVGSPEYFGYMSGLIKDFFDRTYEPARKEKAVFKKPYVVFVSAGQ